MPELPEVETVARDLRRHLLPDGAADRGHRRARGWPRTLRDEDPARFAAGVAGRRIEAIGRRGKQLIVDLSGGAFLTIHLKMTGQLFVVPADAPEDPYVRLVLELDDGRELRFRDIRKFGRVGLYGARRCDPFDGGRAGRAARPALHAARVPRADPRAACRLKPLLVDQSFIAGIGNIYADEALWRLAPAPAALAPAPSGPPTSARLYRDIRRILAEAVERRGSSIDDYTAPDGDGEMQERLDVYQRTGAACRALRAPDPAHRDRDPRDPLLLVVPAAAGGRARRPRGAARDDDARGRGRRRGPAVDRAGWTSRATACGRTADEAAKAASGRRGRARGDRAARRLSRS